MRTHFGTTLAMLAALSADPAIDKRVDIPKLIELHNKERAKEGLGPLEADPKLEAAARLHAEEMARRDVMTHEGADGSMPDKRIERQGYRFQTTGENVAMGQKSPAEVTEAWMNSPHHRDNILKPEFTEIGAACAFTEKGAPYWCVVFGKPWPEVKPAESADAMLEAINAAREKESKPAFKADARLREVAVRHAKAMAEAKKFLQESDGERPTTRAQKEGYPARMIAQADAIGQAEPGKAVARWMEDEVSRKMILGTYDDIGIGVAADDKGVPYWSVLFGQKRADRR